MIAHLETILTMLADRGYHCIIQPTVSPDDLYSILVYRDIEHRDFVVCGTGTTFTEAATEVIDHFIAELQKSNE